MKIILTEEQLRKIKEAEKVALNEAAMPKYMQKRLSRSNSRDIQNEFYRDFVPMDKLFEKFQALAYYIYEKRYGGKNTWEDDNQKRKMAVIYAELKERLENFGNKYLVEFNEVENQASDDIDEQIDTEDDEKELMSQWYGDDEDEDNQDEFDYAPEYDMDSDDSYELSRDKDTVNRMNRSVRVGGAGASDNDKKNYTINGKRYFLTPIEYRRMLKSMGIMTPEEKMLKDIYDDGNDDFFDDDSFNTNSPKNYINPKNDIQTKKIISRLQKEISKIQNSISKLDKYFEEKEAERQEKLKNYEERRKANPNFYNLYHTPSFDNMSVAYRRNEEALNYLRGKLERLLNKYDLITGNVNGEEYNF